MIPISKHTVVDGEALLEWVQDAIRHRLPAEAHVSLIPKPWEAKGESRFVAEVEADVGAIGLDDLVAREVTEHSRGQYVHYYVQDVVAAAIGAGQLAPDRYLVYHRW